MALPSTENMDPVPTGVNEGVNKPESSSDLKKLDDLLKTKNVDQISDKILNTYESLLKADAKGFSESMDMNKKTEEALKRIETITPEEKGKLSPEAVTARTADITGLNTLKSFLEKCMLGNKIVIDAQENISKSLKKMDRGMEEISIMAKDIVAGKPSIDADGKVQLPYTIKGSDATFTIDKDGKVGIKDKSIKVDGKYLTIEKKADATDIRQFEIKEDPNGFTKELGSYKLNGDAKDLNVEKSGDEYQVSFSDKEGNGKGSFKLNENGLYSLGLKKFDQDGYTIDINPDGKSFTITDTRKAEKKAESEADAKEQKAAERKNTLEGLKGFDLNLALIKRIGDIETEARGLSNQGKNAEAQKKHEFAIQLDSLSKGLASKPDKMKRIDEVIQDLEKQKQAIRNENEFDAYTQVGVIQNRIDAVTADKAKIITLDEDILIAASKDDDKEWETVATKRTEMKQITDRYVTEPQKPANALDAKTVLDKYTGDDKDAITTFYEKSPNNKFQDVINLLTIDATKDSDDVKAKKTELQNLLNTGDLKGFQEAIGITGKRNDGTSKVDGKFGPMTLDMTKKYLGQETPATRVTPQGRTGGKVEYSPALKKQGNYKEKFDSYNNATTLSSGNMPRRTAFNDNGESLLIAKIDNVIVRKVEDIKNKTVTYSKFTDKNGGTWEPLNAVEDLFGKVLAIKSGDKKVEITKSSEFDKESKNTYSLVVENDMKIKNKDTREKIKNIPQKEIITISQQAVRDFKPANENLIYDWIAGTTVSTPNGLKREISDSAKRFKAGTYKDLEDFIVQETLHKFLPQNDAYKQPDIADNKGKTQKNTTIENIPKDLGDILTTIGVKNAKKEKNGLYGDINNNYFMIDNLLCKREKAPGSHSITVYKYDNGANPWYDVDYDRNTKTNTGSLVTNDLIEKKFQSLLQASA